MGAAQQALVVSFDTELKIQTTKRIREGEFDNPRP
jgi:hypothetical protein